MPPTLTPTATHTPAAAVPARPRLRGRLHLVGAVVLAASAPLLWQTASTGVLRLAVVVYLVGVTTMLATSAVYHVPDWSTATKQRLRRADHSAIFLGVAGTYTPIVLATLDGWLEVALLALVWTGAAAGIAVRNVFPNAPSWTRTAPYIALGWVGVIALPWIWGHAAGLALLVLAGGVAYTLGAVVYARRRPDPWPATFGYHELFHALTLVAIALHWVAVHQAVSA